MNRMQSASIRAYHSLLAAQPNTPAKVAFAWQLAAGPALGRAGIPRWSGDGTLRIEARDDAWMRELRRARPIITERLAEILGAGVVQHLVIE